MLVSRAEWQKSLLPCQRSRRHAGALLASKLHRARLESKLRRLSKLLRSVVALLESKLHRLSKLLHSAVALLESKLHRARHSVIGPPVAGYARPPTQRPRS